MAATLKQLRDQVRLNSGVTSSDMYPDTRLTKMVNHAQQYVQIQLNALGEKKWETSTTATPSSSSDKINGSTTKDVSISSDLSDMLESPNSIIFVEATDGSTSAAAYELAIKEFAETAGDSYMTPTVTEPRFVRLSGKLRFLPSDITSTTIHYYKVVPDLDADGDTTEIPPEFEQFIVDKAVLDVMASEGQVQEKLARQQELDNRITETYQKHVEKMTSKLSQKKLQKDEI